ncbi:MAG: hypothetical protein IKH57_21405, partial [Clostridia bacterium]|nr:hypothetical protein [Clostridia bacterium]
MIINNRQNNIAKWLIAAVLILQVFPFSFSAGAEEADTLALPQLVETICEWDDLGRLVTETAYDLEGRPALNARGFHRAEYVWGDKTNLLTETYRGLDGKLTDNTDLGYARAEYSYHRDNRGYYHVLTEDRYSASGQRASIPGGYSYRRDEWDESQILSTRYYDADGKLTRPTGGYAQILYEPVKSGYEVTVTKRYLDADGSLMTGPEGGAILVYVYTSARYYSTPIHIEQLKLDMMLPEG